MAKKQTVKMPMTIKDMQKVMGGKKPVGTTIPNPTTPTGSKPAKKKNK